MAMSGVPIGEIIATQSLWLGAKYHKPLILNFELTNNCNLRCSYCSNGQKLRESGYVSDSVVHGVVKGICDLEIKRVRIVGNGEATLHRNFYEIVKELGSTGSYVSLLTNGMWNDGSRIVESIVESGIKMIEFSVEGENEEEFSRYRKGASYQRIVGNLELLRKSIKRGSGRPIINLRVMMHPSQSHREGDLLRHWRRFSDYVMPQYVIKLRTMKGDEDTYTPDVSRSAGFPKCILPFKTIDVNWNGNVPLCCLSVQQVGPPGLIAGNLQTECLREIWNAGIMKQYRDAHRLREKSKMPICKGCSGS